MRELLWEQTTNRQLETMRRVLENQKDERSFLSEKEDLGRKLVDQVKEAQQRLKQQEIRLFDAEKVLQQAVS